MMRRPPTVIDAHCHLASNRCVPREFFAGVAANMARSSEFQGVPVTAEKITQMLWLQHEDHLGDRLVAQMDEAGVDRAVLLVPDFTYVFKSPIDIGSIARQHVEVRERHPNRFWVFQGIDPRWGREGLDLFERTVTEYGFEGLKLYPPCGFSPSSEIVYPLYEICRRHRLPVLVHTGPTSPTLDFSYADPYLIDRAAKDFPEVSFILGHGGVNLVEQAKLMCKYRPNVYLDISPFPVVLSDRGWPQHLASLFAQGLNHKIVFGTDWPVHSLRSGLRPLTDELFSEHGPLKDLDQRSIDGIFGRTIATMVGKPYGD